MTETEPRGVSLDVLRRRVYEPDASEADRERYRGALADAAAQAAESRTSADVDRPDTQSERESESGPSAGPAAGLAAGPGVARARLLIGGVVLAAAATVALVTHPWAPPPSASGPQSRALAIPAAARQAFIAGLDHGGSADFGRYIYDHPDTRPAEVTTLDWAVSEEHVGIGAATVSLDPSGLPNHGGHLTVVLIVTRDGDSAWTASGITPEPYRTASPGSPVTVHGRQVAGVPGTATVRYASVAPTSLTVEVPAGVRWDAFVVFSN